MATGAHRERRRTTALAAVRRIVRVRLKRQARGLSFDYTHTERVTRIALELGATVARETGDPVDLDVVEAAATFHGIGATEGRPPAQRAAITARIAEEMLIGEGLADLVWPVCSVLLDCLSPERTPSTLEAAVIQDAVRIEAIGAVGVVRAVLDAHASAVPALFDPDDPFARRRPLAPTTWLLDRLRGIDAVPADQLLTAAGRAHAAARAEVHNAFVRSLVEELGISELPPADDTAG